MPGSAEGRKICPEHVQDGRAQDQSDQNFAKHRWLPDSGRQAAGKFCGDDREREEEEELEDVGHQDVLKRLVSIPCFRSR